MDWITWVVDLGEKVLPWLATILVGLLSKYVWNRISSEYWSGVLNRATTEIFDAAQEVHQTFVAGIKAGRADGTLSDAEKAQAKQSAIDIAKSNLGPKGFARLAKIFGGEGAANSWIGNKVETSVANLKTVEKSLDSPKL